MATEKGSAYGRMSAAIMAVTAFLSVPIAAAQTEQAPQKKFTNADILKWPQREQIIWVSGAIEGIGNTLALSNGEAARCVLKWYGDGSTKFRVVQESAKLYPSEEPIAVILALANRTCKFQS